MPKPALLTEARAARDHTATQDTGDAPLLRDNAAVARRATAVDTAGIPCAAGDPMGAATIAALPGSAARRAAD
jgi:hypothetical protein